MQLEQQACDELLRADAEFSRMSQQYGPTAAFLAYLADDAVLMQPGRDFLIGYQAIQQAMSQGDAAGATLVWQPIAANVSASGDLGYTYGTYTASQTADEAGSAVHGKYVTIWRRNPAGAWKVAFDGGNPGPDRATRP